MSKLGLGAVLLSLATLAACGGGSTMMQPPPPPPPPVQATVRVNGLISAPLDLAMSTSFQPAEWDDTFFQQFPAATAPLAALNPSHIRLQGISQGVPQGAAGSAATSWDFTVLDDITQPVLGVGDHSPEFQIAKAPPFMYLNNDSSQSFRDLTFQQFAGYAKNLVRYYNTGGFTPPGGSLLVSPAYPNETITWWGIYNEPSINNNLDATEYTTMYNALVPAMQSVDPSLKFVGIELCCGSENWASTFASGVNAQVDVVATHYYSSCNQKDSDNQVMSTVPGFASSVQTIQANLNVNPTLAAVPIWITENNVNADFNAGNGMSACNPGQVFVTDKRGSSAFFAAWRPYVFSQVGKAGARALPLHIHSFLWWIASVLAVRALYRRLLAPRVALIATIIFALAPCHVFPIAWLANREALVSIAFGIPALFAYVRWREGRRSRDAALTAVLFALSMAGGEYAICFGGYVLDAIIVETAPKQERFSIQGTTSI